MIISSQELSADDLICIVNESRNRAFAATQVCSEDEIAWIIQGSLDQDIEAVSPINIRGGTIDSDAQKPYLL